MSGRAEGRDIGSDEDRPGHQTLFPLIFCPRSQVGAPITSPSDDTHQANHRQLQCLPNGVLEEDTAAPDPQPRNSNRMNCRIRDRQRFAINDNEPLDASPATEAEVYNSVFLQEQHLQATHDYCKSEITQLLLNWLSTSAVRREDLAYTFHIGSTDKRSGTSCSGNIVQQSMVNGDHHALSSQPRNQAMAAEPDRLQTFESWQALFKQRPEQLDEAGLYYIADNVRPQESQNVETMDACDTPALLMQTRLRSEIQHMENQFQTRLERMTGRMEAQLQATVEVRVQTEIARIENQFKQVLSCMQDQLEAKVEGMVKTRIRAVQDQLETEVETRMQAVQDQLETEVEARMQAMQNQLWTGVEGMIEVEISHREKQQKEQMEGHYEAERAHTVNRLQSELGRVKEEMDAHLQCQFTQPLTQVLSHINELQVHTRSGFTHVQEQLASEVTKLMRKMDHRKTQLQGEMDKTQTQLIADSRQLKQQMVSDVTQLQSRLQECEQSVTRTQTLLDMQDRMHMGLMADMGRQIRGEMANLKDQIHTVSQQILDVQAQLANQALAIPGIHPHDHQQQGQGLEDAGSYLSVVNGSGSTSEHEHGPT